MRINPGPLTLTPTLLSLYHVALGVDFSTILLAFFLFLLIKTVVSLTVPQVLAFLSVDIIAGAAERKEHRV